MARFNDWVTDRAVRIENTLPFVEQPDLFGTRLLGKYLVITTSGTTGTRGVFLIDQESLSVTNAIFLRMLGAWLSPRDLLRLGAATLTGNARAGLLFATGMPVASGVAIARLQERLGRAVRGFSAQVPLPELVAELNAFRPSVFSSYASVVKLLAGEQEAGRLRINPVLIALAAEGLSLTEYDRIGRVFGATVGNSYAASECPFLSYSCRQQWLHVNADWVVLEPVDADYRPVPPGVRSHTVLISNLANRVQPILRYDLGDSVIMRPDPCPCGNPLPAIRVQGRSADALTFPTGGGERTTLPALVFGTLISDVSGVEMFQLVQTTPTTLRVRLRLRPDADGERVWVTVRRKIDHVLTEHHIPGVAVERASESPQQTPGGKYREIIPLS